MNFEELAFEYFNTFGEQPPILTTLDTNNKVYLQLIKDAIIDEKPLTKDYLGSIFMTDEKAFY